MSAAGQNKQSRSFASRNRRLQQRLEVEEHSGHVRQSLEWADEKVQRTSRLSDDD